MKSLKKKKQIKVDLSFSILFVQELLRAELSAMYDQKIDFFQYHATVREEDMLANKTTQTKLELAFGEYEPKIQTEARIFIIEAIVGPFDFQTAVQHEKQQLCRKVRAECRLSNRSAVAELIEWEPHFMKIKVYGYFGKVIKEQIFIYLDGKICGKKCEAASMMPRTDMLENQKGARDRYALSL